MEMENKKLEIDIENRWAERYAGFHFNTPFQRLMYADLAREINKTKHDTVLEIGCGTCITINLVNAEKKIGVDISLNMLKHAPRNIQRILVDMDHLPFRNNSLDFAFIHSSLHHRADLISPLIELRDSLKHGGKVILQEPLEHKLGKNKLNLLLFMVFRNLKFERREKTPIPVEESPTHRSFSKHYIPFTSKKIGFAILSDKLLYPISNPMSSYTNIIPLAIGRLLDKITIKEGCVQRVKLRRE
jgi:ubiquinone/menaquinone biosynthesis C-methylase UbiE